MQELQGSKEEEKTTCVAALVNRSHSTKPTSPAHRIPIPPPSPGAGDENLACRWCPGTWFVPQQGDAGDL